ncbi:MAG: glycoside hydrolase family 95 protein [Bacteroidota bacterium]
MCKNTIYLGAVLILSLVCCSSPKPEKEPQEHLKLWYTTPAKVESKGSTEWLEAIESRDRMAIPDGWKNDPEWLKALPLGNGSLGLMVYGDVNRERIQLNEESMWSGSPADNDNPEARAAQDKIRQLLFEGKYKEATELTNATQICKGAGSGHGNGAEVPFGCFQTLGDLWLDTGKDAPYENYRRELDLNNAMVRVTYTQEGVHYKREFFSSYPDQVVVARFTADVPGKISFNGTMTRPERYRTYVENDQLIMSGTLADGKGGDNLKYLTRLKVINSNGKLRYSGSRFSVTAADEVVLYLSASTDHVLEYPDYKGRDYVGLTANALEEAVQKGYETLLKDHLEEYKNYYERVEFDITPLGIEEIPTDKRLENYIAGTPDPRLEELIFQYGRYLLISSSRPGTLPANLQGIWADQIQTPWNGDYHTDVNVEMNYWLAETANLSEIHEPLFRLIESLVEPGRRTASIQYGNSGWVVHPITNVWGYTSPGERAHWGMHTGAGAWICQHILEHYRFTEDLDFLSRMYPVLEGSVAFYMDWLVEHPESGQLVSGPAVSPENTFIAPDRSQSQISMGPAHDQQVVWQLFADFLQASEELGTKTPLAREVALAKERLAGPQIGSDGRLMEWAEEFPEQYPGHRHISHLFAVHPGAQINTRNTPHLAEAARKSLDYRIENGGGHTGWSAAWLINQYARLKEAEKAKRSLETVLTKSTSPNLFGQHPPFQMDANFGTTSGIAEMLLQSHTGIVELLPALPGQWHTGKVRGLRARGGITVDLEWQNGALKSANFLSDTNQDIAIGYRGRERTLSLKKGEIYSLKGM